MSTVLSLRFPLGCRLAACDHTIPLLPGAPSVAVRQYRYKPALKSEIEQQVSKLLQSGMV